MKEGISGRGKSMHKGMEAEKVWHTQGTQVLLENKRAEGVARIEGNESRWS